MKYELSLLVTTYMSEILLYLHLKLALYNIKVSGKTDASFLKI